MSNSTGSSYCGAVETGALLQSTDTQLYLVYTSNSMGGSFSATWEKVPSKLQIVIFLLISKYLQWFAVTQWS